MTSELITVLFVANLSNQEKDSDAQNAVGLMFAASVLTKHLEDMYACHA